VDISAQYNVATPDSFPSRRFFLKVFGAFSESQIKEPKENHPQHEDLWQVRNRASYAFYAMAFAVSISIWFIAIRAPQGLDETGSYWAINAGFSGIWPRHFLSILFPAYSYILWLSTKLIGTSEIALRIPSILAMLGAAYLLYLAAREIFEHDLAIIATVIFCLHPIVVFASIDIRPYAFGVLATNAAILVLLRLRRSSSNWLAALFGLTAASIVWFHYLLGVILPALLLCFIAFKFRDRKTFWKQFSFALAAFALAFLPVIPGLMDMFRTSKTHVYELAPNLFDLARTLAPRSFLFVLCATGFVAFLIPAARQRRDPSNRFEGWHLLLCASLALIPILILYGVSVGTSIHTFASRHRLEAIPGIALCWVFVLSRFSSRNLRLLFCAAIVAITAFQSFTSPFTRVHKKSMRSAIEFVERNASVDDAPVLMCSDFVESNYAAMQSIETVKDSPYFAPLTYYRLSVPVIPLPQLINDETIQVGSQFLQEAAQNHKRFLVVADQFYSYRTLDWFTSNAAATHSVHNLGVFSGTEVLEFVPRTSLAPQSD